jgi:hypothetical protein
MSSSTDFIAELARAASEVEKLGAYEMAHLLERSMLTIREMRATRGIRLTRHAKDPLIDIENVQDRVMRGIVVQRPGCRGALRRLRNDS